MDTSKLIALIKTFHATPGDVQNEEIRAALTAIVSPTNEVELSAADIVAMFTTPVEVVAAPGAGKVIEFISAVLVYTFDVAAYTGGGAVSIINAGGAAVSSNIAAADSFGAAGDKVFSMALLNADGGFTMPVNTGLEITNATGVFVDPGTAVGTAKLIITYKVHTTGL